MNEPVLLFKDFFDKELNSKIFSYFKNLNWEQDEYKIYDKIVKSPRLTYFYGKSYSYTGQTKKGHTFDKQIKYIANQIEKYLKLDLGHFNGCLLNYYRDGKDYISYHNDNEKDMIENGIIAVISIGQERKFYIKNNTTKEVVKFSLPNGSLAIMNPICQKEWKHSIPKELKVKGERISLTFRKFK